MRLFGQLCLPRGLGSKQGKRFCRGGSGRNGGQRHGPARCRRGNRCCTHSGGHRARRYMKGGGGRVGGRGRSWTSRHRSRAAFGGMVTGFPSTCAAALTTAWICGDAAGILAVERGTASPAPGHTCAFQNLSAHHFLRHDQASQCLHHVESLTSARHCGHRKCLSSCRRMTFGNLSYHWGLEALWGWVSCDVWYAPPATAAVPAG